MNRREFVASSFGTVILVALPGGSVLFLDGCAGGDEFINILNLLSPAVDGVVLIVDLVNPTLGATIQAGVTIFEQEIPVVTQLYNDWKIADAAAQPGVLGKLDAAIAVLKKDALGILAAAHITDPTHQNMIDNLINAVLAEITQIAGLVGFTQASGGTTQAALKVVKKSSLGKPVISSKRFRNTAIAELSQKTGNAQLDATCASIAAKIKAA